MVLIQLIFAIMGAYKCVPIWRPKRSLCHVFLTKDQTAHSLLFLENGFSWKLSHC